MKNLFLNNPKRYAVSLLAGCLAALVLTLPSCLDVDDDDTDNVTKAEIALVKYLDANYPGQWKQYYSANLYYVPVKTVADHTGLVSPKVGKHCVQISYDMWKQDDYDASWRVSDQYLISTSDSLKAVRHSLLRNYLHGGPEIYPYVDGLSDYAAIIGEMYPGETYRVFMAPSMLSGFKDYTRVMDLTLENVFEGSEWTAEETSIFKAYRVRHPQLKNMTWEEQQYSYQGEKVYYYTVDEAEYLVEDALKKGTIQYTLHDAGLGDPLTNGGPVRLEYSYGYLQRNHAGKAGVSYVEVAKTPYPVNYDILTNNMFGRGFDKALTYMRIGTEATVFVPALLSFGWTGVTSKQGFGGTDLYEIPPLAPLVFHVKILPPLAQ